MKVEIIVFDLYNTLIHIQQKNNLFAQIYRKCQTHISLSFPEYINLVLTKRIDELKTILPNVFAKEYESLKPKFEEEINSVKLFPESESVLKDLAFNYKLYLISNLASVYKKPYFNLNLSGKFDQAIFSCDFGTRKPNPKIFERVEKLSGKSGNQILMVGDSVKSDIEGAKQLNWKYLRINRQSNSQNPWEIKSLTEISNNLKPA